MHVTHILSPKWLLLCLWLSVVAVSLTDSDHGRGRRVIENFEQDLDDEEIEPYYSEQEFDLDLSDDGENVEGDVDTTEVVWNDGEEDREDSDDEGKR